MHSVIEDYNLVLSFGAHNTVNLLGTQSSLQCYYKLWPQRVWIMILHSVHRFQGFVYYIIMATLNHPVHNKSGVRSLDDVG